MFAMMFGVYEKALNIISNLKTELKKNFKFIFLLGLSASLAIIFGSGVIKHCLNKYYLQTMLLFIGMMLGGIKPLFNNIKGNKIKTKNIVIALIVVTLLVLMSLIDIDIETSNITKTPLTVLILFISGFLDAMATVIPGICGTALLMILGYYNVVIHSLSDIFNISNIDSNLFVLIPFLIGLILGIYLISKLVNYLFKHHRITTYYSIIGFAITSIALLVLQVLERTYQIKEIIIGLFLLILGYIISYLLEKNGKN